jgi:hypothetical protein
MFKQIEKSLECKVDASHGPILSWGFKPCGTHGVFRRQANTPGRALIYRLSGSHWMLAVDPAPGEFDESNSLRVNDTQPRSG